MSRNITHWIAAACLAVGGCVNGVETLPPLGENGVPRTLDGADQVIARELQNPPPVFTATREKKTPDYDTGMMIRSQSEITFFLNRNFTGFQAVGAPYWQASVVYEVWADGEKLFESKQMTGRSQPALIDVDLTGKQELRLVVTDA